jgi:hypothetical protein
MKIPGFLARIFLLMTPEKGIYIPFVQDSKAVEYMSESIPMDEANTKPVLLL